MADQVGFRDRAGRVFNLTITVGALARVKRETGVDLSRALSDDSALASLIFGDPAALVSVLYVLSGTDVDPEGFADGFDGPTVERATEALMAAVADFFPRARVAGAIRESLTSKLRDLDTALIDAISKPCVGNSPGK